MHYLRRGKDGALLRLGDSLAEMEVHTSPGIGNIFAAKAVGYSAAVSDTKCLFGEAGNTTNIIAIISIIHIITVKQLK